MSDVMLDILLKYALEVVLATNAVMLRGGENAFFFVDISSSSRIK